MNFSPKSFNQILALIPFLFYLVLILRKRKAYELKKVPIITSILLLLIMAFFLGITPIEDDTDKSRYLQRFLGEGRVSDKDIGWQLYNIYMGSILGNNFLAFFILTALIYSFSYFILALKYLPRNYIGYFIIMVCGSIGFSGYGNNTIRMGLALAMMMIVVSLPLKAILKYLLLIIPVLIHASMIVPIFSFTTAYLVKNKRVFEVFWVLCLIIVIIGISPETLFEEIGFVDKRITDYSSNVADGSEYKAGFRFDFLLYSVVPIFIANKWIRKYKYRNRFYLTLYSSYLFSNSIWILMILTDYNDRIAYLSWFLIPLLTLYPLLNYDFDLKMKNISKNVLVIMGIFISLNLLLSLR